jgi:hypothetical protein
MSFADFSLHLTSLIDGGMVAEPVDPSQSVPVFERRLTISEYQDKIRYSERLHEETTQQLERLKSYFAPTGS